jgi:hypothetical protein
VVDSFGVFYKVRRLICQISYIAGAAVFLFGTGSVIAFVTGAAGFARLFAGIAVPM